MTLVDKVRLIDLGEEFEESDNSGRLFCPFKKRKNITRKKAPSDAPFFLVIAQLPKGLLHVKEDINQNVQGGKTSVTVLLLLVKAWSL